MTDNLRQAIEECELSDRHSLRRQLDKLDKQPRQGDAFARQVAQLQSRIMRSCERGKARWQQVPKQIQVPASLPIAEHAQELLTLLQQHQVLVVAGETGSGKTTQLPKLCLQAGLGRYGRIGHTQPRRLAAISVANRIAEELGTTVGSGVGYQIRFKDVTTPQTYLKLMTDGILLAEIQQDRFLNAYEVLIIDEAHERSLNIDFLLGFLKQLLPRRPELKLIITSATIDLEKFSRHFDDAPIVTVSGRTFPVEMRYAPLSERADGGTDADDLQSEGVLDALHEIMREDRKRGSAGDVLVFFSSEKEIREAALRIRKLQLPDTEVLPLYARLRQADQVRIFSPHRGRRVILATNIAETSLTVPGIRYVIDTGLARISRYSVQSKIQRLPIEPVSQASARQRAGRCGRVAAGVCIRLYSEQDYDSRPSFTDPEIRRTNLAAVILQMLYLRLGDVSEFPFIDPPETKAINDGFKLLFELGAIDADHRLTAIGKTMARLPVDPRFGRMLIAADALGCLMEIAIIVSVLSIQDPRDVPADKRQQARERQAVFAHPDSDFLGLVNLWQMFERRRQDMNRSGLRKFCKDHFLSDIRMREWRETHRQLLMLARAQALKLNREEGTYRDVHTALLAGSLNQVGNRTEGNEYLGSRNRKFRLLPSSSLSGKPPKWIVSGEIFETAQAYSAACARIEPDWIEAVAGHLTRKSWSDPHWSSKRQRVMAYEKVTLYGLVIVEKRQVTYGEIDPRQCREIFIGEALAGQQLESTLPFYRHNSQLLDDIEKQEEKVRKQSFFLDSRRIEDFYAERIPDHVIDRASLVRWYRKAAQKRPDLLQMSIEDLLPRESRDQLQQDFPDRATLHNNPLTVEYQFDPGSQRDGATIEVPAPLLEQLEQKDLDWAIPGQVRERSIQLLKTLPKAVRKQLIPIPGFVDRALEGLDFERQEVDLISVLGERARQLKGVNIRRDMLKPDELPEYLKVKILVVDVEGRQIAAGSELAAVREDVLPKLEPRQATAQPATQQTHPIEREDMHDWNLDDLPERLEIGTQLKLVRFPALIDGGESVAVRLVSDAVRARAQTRRGLTRLYMLRSSQQRKELLKLYQQRQRRWGLKLPVFLNVDTSAEDFVFAIYYDCFDVRGFTPRTREQFEASLGRGKTGLYETAQQLLGVLDRVVEGFFAITSRLATMEHAHQAYLREDVEGQLEHLFSSAFMLYTPFTWLRNFPRYCEAVSYRLDKAIEQPDRDRHFWADLQPFWQRLLKLERGGRSLHEAVEDDDILLQYRWMVEEYRVSLFAQPLGTKVPASSKRLEKLWQKISDS